MHSNATKIDSFAQKTCTTTVVTKVHSISHRPAPNTMSLTDITAHAFSPDIQKFIDITVSFSPNVTKNYSNYNKFLMNEFGNTCVFATLPNMTKITVNFL